MSGLLIWVYGLPQSGQEQLAEAVAVKLREADIAVSCLHLNAEEEIGGGQVDYLRFAEQAVTLASDSVVIASSVSDSEEKRQLAWQAARTAGVTFLDCYLRLPIDKVITANPDGILVHAVRGERDNVPAINFPFQQPQAPQLIVEGSGSRAENLVFSVLDYLNRNIFLPGFSFPASPQASAAAPASEQMADPFAEIPASHLVGLITLADAVAEPTLVGAWASAFTVNDDAVLVFYAPDISAQAAIAELVPFIAEQGMAAEDSGELILLAGCRSETVDRAIEARTDLRLGSAEDCGLSIRARRPSSEELRQLLDDKIVYPQPAV